MHRTRASIGGEAERRPFHQAMLALILLPLTLAGCANRSGLTMQSIEHRHIYSTLPTAAYYMRDPDGSHNVVIVRDPLDVPPLRTGRSITPAAEPPLRQIVHLRILWRPRRTPQEREQLAANASIDWHLFGVGLEGERDRLHYQGAGMVTIDSSGDTARILIRRGLLRPVESQGRLADPLGPSQLSGSVMAQRDPKQVVRLLEQIKKVQATATAD